MTTIEKKRKREKVTSGQVQEMTGWLRRLTPDEYQERRGLIQRVTNPKIAIGPALLYPFKDDRPLKEGWLERVEREGALCEGPIDISCLEAVPFHKDGEDWVSGDEMMRRASDAQSFPGCQGWSQHYAEQLFARAAELPEEMRPFVLPFTDTILVDRDGRRLVAVLLWLCGRWQLGWDWLGDDFDRDCRLLRFRK